MSKPYWKCERCGSEFETEEILVRESYDHNPAETDYMCPNCRSFRIEEGGKCEYCGKWYDIDDEYFEDCCNECGKDSVDAMESYLRFNKPMTEEQKTIFWDYWGCL